MKKTHIIGIIVIALAIGILMSMSGEVATYSAFSDAKGSDAVAKIAGQLKKDKEMYYNPEEDPNYFSFYLEDFEGEVKKVVLLSDKPQDFEMSEQIVVTGQMKGEEFIATDILLKCPSKYKDEEIALRKKMS